jgi:hypothetical protein
MTHIRHPEWRDSHDPTNYPFEDDALLTNAAGITIDPSTFLDAALYPVGGTGQYYLSKLVITNTTTTVYVGDETNTQLASASFQSNAVPDSLRLVDTYGRAAGLLVSEAVRLTQLKSLGVGTHTFSSSQTPFVASVCIPMPGIGVQGLLLDDGSVVSGDVWLVGDGGIVLSSSQVTVGGYCETAQRTFTAVRVDAVGDPLFRRALCASPAQFQTSQFIERICFTTPELKGTGTSEVYSEGNADILILVDTTGSMSGFLSTLKTVMPDILTTVTATAPDATIRWAVAGYRDYEDGGDYASYGYKLHLPFTSDSASILSAINALTAGGGGDTSEQNLAALLHIATGWDTLTGSSTAGRGILWAGDVPGWEDGAKGQPYPTFQATLNELVDQNIAVFALNQKAAGAGLDAPGPAPSDGRYQASTITTETDGGIYHSVNTAVAAEVAAAIVDSVITVVTSGEGSPAVLSQILCCGPGERGNINITVGSQDVPDTILRVRPSSEGLIIEAVGEKLEDIR